MPILLHQLLLHAAFCSPCSWLALQRAEQHPGVATARRAAASLTKLSAGCQGSAFSCTITHHKQQTKAHSCLQSRTATAGGSAPHFSPPGHRDRMQEMKANAPRDTMKSSRNHHHSVVLLAAPRALTHSRKQQAGAGAQLYQEGFLLHRIRLQVWAPAQHQVLTSCFTAFSQDRGS